MRTRNRQINFYLSEKEYESLQKKISKTKLNQSDFLREMIFKKNIFIFSDLDKFLIELKRIGNNINQLTKAVNQGKINCKNEVEELSEEVRGLWQLLKSLKADKV